MSDRADGVALLARWGIPQLLALDHGRAPAGTPWDPTSVAADLFLYVLYNRTVGRRVLDVSGDEASDALVYAHCAKTGRPVPPYFPLHTKHYTIRTRCI